MRLVDQVLKMIVPDINKRDVLEVACGCAEFSLAACRNANRVCCIDLDSSRMIFDPKEQPNLEFEIMDATRMRYEDQTLGVSIKNGRYFRTVHFLIGN